MRHNRECNHYRTQYFRSTQIMAHMGTQANISGITCHSNAAFAKQMCLETAVKGFLSLNKNGNKFKTQHTSRVYDYQQFVSLCTDTFD